MKNHNYLFHYGMEVRLKMDKTYIGVVIDIDRKEHELLIEFYEPIVYTQVLAMDEVMPVHGRDVFFVECSDETRLNVEEIKDLNRMYVELALMTNDKEWFYEVVKKIT